MFFITIFGALQSRDPSSKMTTEFFALPGLHHASPSNNDVKVFEDERGSRQMCTDSWGSSSCVDEESHCSSIFGCDSDLLSEDVTYTGFSRLELRAFRKSMAYGMEKHAT